MFAHVCSGQKACQDTVHMYIHTNMYTFMFAAVEERVRIPCIHTYIYMYIYIHTYMFAAVEERVKRLEAQVRMCISMSSCACTCTCTCMSKNDF